MPCSSHEDRGGQCRVAAPPSRLEEGSSLRTHPRAVQRRQRGRASASARRSSSWPPTVPARVPGFRPPEAIDARGLAPIHDLASLALVHLRLCSRRRVVGQLDQALAASRWEGRLVEMSSGYNTLRLSAATGTVPDPSSEAPTNRRGASMRGRSDARGRWQRPLRRRGRRPRRPGRVLPAWRWRR